MLLSFCVENASHFIGDACCESIQNVYLKWHKHDQWSLVGYSEGYASKFDQCDGLELMDRLTEMHLEEPPSEYELCKMGWRGPMVAEVFEFVDYYVGS